MDCSHEPPLSLDFPGKNTGVGCHLLLRGIFLTQGSNLGLLHCRQLLYLHSHQGGPCALNGPLKAWQPLGTKVGDHQEKELGRGQVREELF